VIWGQACKFWGKSYTKFDSIPRIKTIATKGGQGKKEKTGKNAVLLLTTPKTNSIIVLAN
jgi:hypothetical protein